MSSQAVEQMIESYFSSTTEAIAVLFRANLLPHSLVIIYSTIDTCGLLDAPATQTEATGGSFKEWVKKYVLTDPTLEFNEVDLWGARCAVLHTFTSQSKLSNAGQARQLQYYTGEKSEQQTQKIIESIRGHENGAHLPVHYGDLAGAVLAGMRSFIPDLESMCLASPSHQDRLRKVVQTYSYKPTA